MIFAIILVRWFTGIRANTPDISDDSSKPIAEPCQDADALLNPARPYVQAR